MQIFEKFPQISGLCPIVKFCPNPPKTDPSQQKNPAFISEVGFLAEQLKPGSYFGLQLQTEIYYSPQKMGCYCWLQRKLKYF